MKVSWLSLLPGVVFALGLLLGLLTALADVAAICGDDTEKVIVALWLLCTGLLGFVQPDQAWRWALVVGLWVPLVHLVLHVFQLPDSLNPNSLVTILILVPLSLVVCLIGSYGGVLLRRVVGAVV